MFSLGSVDRVYAAHNVTESNAENVERIEHEFEEDETLGDVAEDNQDGAGSDSHPGVNENEINNITESPTIMPPTYNGQVVRPLTKEEAAEEAYNRFIKAEKAGTKTKETIQEYSEALQYLLRSTDSRASEYVAYRKALKEAYEVLNDPISTDRDRKLVREYLGRTMVTLQTTEHDVSYLTHKSDRFTKTSSEKNVAIKNNITHGRKNSQDQKAALQDFAPKQKGQAEFGYVDKLEISNNALALE